MGESEEHDAENDAGKRRLWAARHALIQLATSPHDAAHTAEAAAEGEAAAAQGEEAAAAQGEEGPKPLLARAAIRVHGVRVEVEQKTALEAWLAARCPALRRHAAQVQLQSQRRDAVASPHSLGERMLGEERFHRQCSAAWLRECSQVRGCGRETALQR